MMDKGHKALDRAKVMLAKSRTTTKKYAKGARSAVAKVIAGIKAKVAGFNPKATTQYASYAAAKAKAVAGKRQFWVLLAVLAWAVANLGYTKVVEVVTWLAYQTVNLALNIAAWMFTIGMVAFYAFPVDLVNRLRGGKAVEVAEGAEDTETAAVQSKTTEVIALWKNAFVDAVGINTYFWNAVRKVALNASVRSAFLIISTFTALEFAVKVWAGATALAAFSAVIVPFLASFATMCALGVVLYVAEDKFGLLTWAVSVLGKIIGTVIVVAAVPVRALGNFIVKVLDRRRNRNADLEKMQAEFDEVMQERAEVTWTREEQQAANASLLQAEIDALKADLEAMKSDRDAALEAALLFEQAAKEAEGRRPKHDPSKKREKRGSGNPAKRAA